MTDVPWNKLAERSVRLKVPETWPFEQHVKHLKAFPCAKEGALLKPGYTCLLTSAQRRERLLR